MKQSLTLGGIVLAALTLAGCGEEPQAIGTGIAPGAAAFQGTGKAAPFTAPGWKQGDKTSWEQQLKTRTQTGQNDYAKVN